MICIFFLPRVLNSYAKDCKHIPLSLKGIYLMHLKCFVRCKIFISNIWLDKLYFFFCTIQTFIHTKRQTNERAQYLKMWIKDRKNINFYGFAVTQPKHFLQVPLNGERKGLTGMSHIL